MNINKKFVNTTFDIFGYSFVGILAYCFGLVLQNYNSRGGIIVAIKDYAQDARCIIFILLTQVLVILLFGHAYATNVLIEKQDLQTGTGIDVFGVVGHWIETLIICILAFLLFIQIIKPILFTKYFWFTILAILTIYILSFFAYRRLKSDGYSYGKNTARYTLVCPALLMIGVNIYSGANILAFLEGSLISFVPMGLFFLCLLCLYIIDDKHLKILYVACPVIIVSTGILSVNTKLPYATRLVAKNFFLAIMVTIFLSIFESWYVAFRQMQNSTRKVYMKVSAFVVAAMPAIVFFLYPYQDFNIIYIVAFFIGMCITDYVSFVIVLPMINGEKSMETNTKRDIAILRAFCGITTLVCLMMDKYIIINPMWKNNEKYEEMLKITPIVISVIALIISYFDIRAKAEKHITIAEMWGKIWKKSSGKLCITNFFTFRLIVYVAVWFINSGISGFLESDLSKDRLSSYGVFLFFIETVVILVLYEKTKNRNQSDGTQQ